MSKWPSEQEIKEGLVFENYLAYGKPIRLFKLLRIPEQHGFVILATVKLELISWLSEKSDEVCQPILWYSVLHGILKTKVRYNHVQLIQKPNKVFISNAASH